MNTTFRFLIFSLVLPTALSTTALLAADTTNKPTLTLDGAKRAGDAAEAYAAKAGSPGGGNADSRTLYLAAQTSIYRLRLNLPGAGAALHPDS